MLPALLSASHRGGLVARIVSVSLYCAALALSGCAGLLKTNTASWVSLESGPEFEQHSGGWIDATLVVTTRPETVGRAVVHDVRYVLAEYDAGGVKLGTTVDRVDVMQPGERARLKFLLRPGTARIVVEEASFDLGRDYSYKLADVGTAWPVN
jgi:hypothetical protein